MLNRIIGLSFMLIIGFLGACAPKPAPVARTAIEKTREVVAEPALKKGWEAEWENTLKEAKREGKVTIYTSAGPSVRIAIQEGFQKRYGIRVEFIVGTGGELAEKIKALKRAGINEADLFNVGASVALTMLKPAGLLDKLEPMFLLPELTETELIKKTWWQGTLRWLDKDRTTLAFISWAMAPMTFNTTLAKEEELASWRDLLNPKWKGKILIFDPTIPGAGSKVIGVLGDKIMDWDFVRELAKMEPVTVSDHRLLTEWLARGKYAIAVGTKPDMVQDFQKLGSPLQNIIPKKEGTHLESGTGVISILAKAPHPEASKIFVNWLLSQEGQTIFSQAYAAPSVRLDVPTEDFDSLILLQHGKSYVIGDDEEFMALRTRQLERNREIFGVTR